MSVPEMTPDELLEQYVAAVDTDLAAATGQLETLQVQLLAVEDRINSLRTLRARHIAALATLEPAEPKQAPEPPTETGILPTVAQPSFDDVVTGQVAS